MANRRRANSNRRGSVYLAVLGTGLIVSLLALSALALQRLQNRMLTASADVRQAQLNAEAAVELGLLAIKQDSNWRTTYSNGTWFSSRSTGDGACTLSVADPVDANLADDTTDPIVMTGIGTSGTAVQRVVRTFDSHTESLECLRSSVAAGGNVALTGAVLRATNSGLISANATSATSSTIYGKVQAVTVTGSTYSGTTQQIAAADLPAMPTWSTVFNSYRTNGTEITFSSLPATNSINLVLNNSFTTTSSYWTGDAPDWTNNVPSGSTTLPDATLNRVTSFAGHTACVQVTRSSKRAGPLQYVDSVLKPNATYTITTEVYFAGALASNMFRIGLYLQFADGTAATVRSTPVLMVNLLAADWHSLSATLTLPNWSGDLKSAFVIVNSDDTAGSSHWLLRRQHGNVRNLGDGTVHLSHGPRTGRQSVWRVDQFPGAVLDRLRQQQADDRQCTDQGHAVGRQSGAGSSVGPGPVRWSPVVAGYPALLVDADTAANADIVIAASNRPLNETENAVNYNPSGASSDDFGQDTDLLDIYPSEIQGLVVVEDDITFQNNALVHGQMIAGGDVTATSGTLEVVYRPDALFSPPPGFTAPSSVVGRPVSIRKAVLP